MAFEFSEGLQLVDSEETHIYQSFNHLTAVAKTGEAPGELWYPRGIAIDPATNRIFIAEGKRGIIHHFARVSTFSESGEYLNSYTHKHIKLLWGIAIRGNNVYLTDWKVHTVFHLKIEADFRLVARQGGRGSGIGQFNQPRQLSISTNGDLYIADSNNDRIQILDSSLIPVREVTHPSMHEPYDVKLSTEEMYVLSSVDSPCIHVFTHTGHKLRSIITCGYGMQAARPFFFWLDSKKNLIISDFWADKIKIFSNEGALLNAIGEHGRQVGRFYCPQGLALTSNLKLVTVSLKNTTGLQMFFS